MKKSIKQFTHRIISDNWEFIASDVKVCDYLINEAENAENGFYEYMSEAEICKYEGNQDLMEALESEIKDFLRKNYNYYL